MQQDDLIPHLFRAEFGKITAVLCKTFGIQHIEAAEDIASETFLAALETWTYKGIPPNPAAWLYAVAKNKAVTFLQRNQLFEKKIAKALLPSGAEEEPVIDLSVTNITDSQLKMLFTICHPLLPVESQVGLALRILCGFGIDEIANAFLTNRDTINKRLYRAKEKLRQQNVKIELPDTFGILQRQETVLATIYLLFNEGYYSESKNEVIREELCVEAMRLNYLLLENPFTASTPAKALMALICFHASRLAARKNHPGEMALYEEQDISLWNKELIARGSFYLHEASSGGEVSSYHLEAAIAYWHTQRKDTSEKWNAILYLYDQLLKIKYSPIAALNRAFAIAKAEGIEKGINETIGLNMTGNPFWWALMGELYSDRDAAKAAGYFEKAIELTVPAAGKNTLRKKMDALNKK